jgi:hypothetical protein
MIQCPYCKRKWFEDSKSNKFILQIGRCVGCIDDNKSHFNNELKFYEVEKLNRGKIILLLKELSKC